MKRSRVLQLTAGTLIFLVAGLVYAWSTFSLSISQEYPHWTQAQLSLTYSLVWIFFCVGGILSALIAGKLRPSVILITCGILFFGSFLWAANAHSLPGLYLSFGILGGLLTGIVYNTAIVAVSLWYPDRPGLCSGIMLSGFGFSAFLIGNAYQAWTPAEIGAWRTSFVVLGAVVCAVICFCALIVRAPGSDFHVEAAQKKHPAPDLPTSRMLRTPKFWVYYLWGVLFVGCGNALVAHSSRIAMEASSILSPATVALAASLISVCNGGFRSVFGAIFDRYGLKLDMLIIATGYLLASVLLIAALKLSSFPLALIAFLLCGTMYGGMAPCAAAFVGSNFGQKHYSINFSVFNTSMIPASLFSTLAGAMYDASGTYLPFCCTIMLCAMICYGLIFTLSALNRKGR